MYTNVSTAFATAIAQKNQTRSYKCTVTYKNSSGTSVTETLDASKWEMGSTSISDGCLPGSYFQLGGTVSRSINTVLKNENGDFTGCKFAGGVLKPYFGLYVDGAFEWVQLGTFVIDSCSKTTAKAIKITGCDKLLKGEKLLSDCNISFPITLKSLLQRCANEIGAVLATTSFHNDDLIMNEPPDKTQVTIRELIGGIAAVAGGFACINYSDALEIKSFTLANPITLAPDATRYSVDVGEVNTIDSAVYYGSERNFLKGDSEGKYPVSVEQNAVFENLENGSAAVTQILNTLITGYSGLSIVPIRVDFAGDPRLQAGDPIYLPNTADGDITTVLTSINMTITASSSGECIECDEIDANFYNSNTSGSGSGTGTGSGSGSGSGSGTGTSQDPVYVDTPIYNLLRRSIYAYPLVNYSYDLDGFTVNCNLQKAEILFGTKYREDNSLAQSFCNSGQYMWMPVLEVDTNLRWGSSFTSSFIKRDYHYYKNQIMPIFVDNDNAGVDNLYFTLQWLAPEGGIDDSEVVHGAEVDVYIIEYPTNFDPRDWANISQLEEKIVAIDESGDTTHKYTLTVDDDIDKLQGQQTTPGQRVFVKTVHITNTIPYDRYMIVLKPHSRYKCKRSTALDARTWQSVEDETIGGKLYQSYCPIAISRACLSYVDVSAYFNSSNNSHLNTNIGFGTSENISIVSDKTAICVTSTNYTLGSPHTINNVDSVIGFAPPRDSDLDPTYIDYHDGQYWELEGGGSGSGSGGADGADGVGIDSMEQTTVSSDDGGINVWTCTLTDGTKSTFEVKNGSKGSKGDKGDQGEIGETGAQGEPGDDGVGILDITQSGSTLTVHLSDNTTRTFTIPSGGSGSGGTGADGVGIASIEQTTISTEDGGVNIITCTLTDGTTSTFEIRNGSKGADGTSGGSSEGTTSGFTNMLKITSEGIVTYTQTDAQTPDLYEELSNYIANIIMGGSF